MGGALNASRSWPNEKDTGRPMSRLTINGKLHRQSIFPPIVKQNCARETQRAVISLKT